MWPRRARSSSLRRSSRAAGRRVDMRRPVAGCTTGRLNGSVVVSYPDAVATDAELARAAQTGDSGALGLLLQRHQASLQAHALKIVGHDHAADAVQDTFL